MPIQNKKFELKKKKKKKLREGNDNPLQYSCLLNPMAEEPGGLYRSRAHKEANNSL